MPKRLVRKRAGRLKRKPEKILFSYALLLFLLNINPQIKFDESIIFIDEAEAILPARGSRQSSDVDKTIVPTFLSELDGFEGDNPFLMLSSNLPDSIDKAVLREGRIDLKIEIARPTESDSVDIFEIHLKKVKLVGEIKDLCVQSAKYLFEKQKEISGAKIATCVKMATHHAVNRYINDKNSEKGVTFVDIKKAIESFKN